MGDAEYDSLVRQLQRLEGRLRDMGTAAAAAGASSNGSAGDIHQLLEESPLKKVVSVRTAWDKLQVTKQRGVHMVGRQGVV